MSDDDRTPFILLEADCALWYVDGDDLPIAEAWLGGRTPEKLTLSGEHKTRVLQYPGEAFGRAYHEDEEHSIELTNTRLLDRSAGPPRMPVMQRGVRYQFAVLWNDPDRAVWTR